MKNSSMTRRYYLLSMVMALISNRVLFDGARLINRNLLHLDMSLPIDRLIPFLPWTIVIYVGVNAWWLYIYWIVTKRGRQEADRFFCANLMAKAVSFLFFIVFPTAITRPELNGNSIWVFFMDILYRLDQPDNLFPSIHCVLGWLCWVGVRGKKDIPPWCRTVSFILAVAVCISTMTVRQHVLADVAAGILVSEVCYAAVAAWELTDGYAAWMDKLLCVTGARKEVPQP